MPKLLQTDFLEHWAAIASNVQSLMIRQIRLKMTRCGVRWPLPRAAVRRPTAGPRRAALGRRNSQSRAAAGPSTVTSPAPAPCTPDLPAVHQSESRNIDIDTTKAFSLQKAAAKSTLTI